MAITGDSNGRRENATNLNSEKHEVHDGYEDIKKFVSDLTKMISGPSFANHPDLQHLKDRLEEGTKHLYHATSEVVSNAQERVEKLASNTNKYVHDSPWQIAGFALAIGMGLGFAFGRR